MATTFVKIATVTVGAGGAATIDFTSIPSTYTDLCLKLSSRNSGTAPDMTISFNGSTSSYNWVLISGNGSSAGSNSGANSYGLLNAQSSATASTFSNCEMYIPNYAATNKYKSASIDSLNENNATANNMYLSADLWSNNAAINQITLTPTSGNFVQYSTATLYGISKS